MLNSIHKMISLLIFWTSFGLCIPKEIGTDLHKIVFTLRVSGRISKIGWRESSMSKRFGQWFSAVVVKMRRARMDAPWRFFSAFGIS